MKRTIKLEITLTNKWLYSFIGVIIIVVLGFGVWAYNSDMRAGNPPATGHSAGEINVENSAGEIVSLQEALDNLYQSQGGIPCNWDGGYCSVNACIGYVSGGHDGNYWALDTFCSEGFVTDIAYRRTYLD